MFQRTLRWNGVGVVFALVLAFAFAAPQPARCQAPAVACELTSALQSWWSELWATKLVASADSSAVDPTQVTINRTSAIDPNGLKGAGRGDRPNDRGTRAGSARPRG